MPSLLRDNCSLHYSVAGHGERTPLLCLHGGACSGADFDPLAERLGGNRQLIALDQRGHGDSEACPGPYDPTTLAADAAALLDELGIDRVVVIGHSLGAPVALELIRRECDIAGVVSIDGPLVLSEGMGAGMGQLVQAFDGGQGPAAFRQFMEAVAGYAQDAEQAGALVDSLCSTPEHVIGPLVAAVTAYDGTDVLGASTLPILHIDAGFGVCDLDRLAELRPDAWIGKVVGTGHYPHLESPDQIASMVQHFLDTHRL